MEADANGQMQAGKQYGMQPPQQQGKDNKDENGSEVGTNKEMVLFNQLFIVFRCKRCLGIWMAGQ